jgi:hypothetical protein
MVRLATRSRHQLTTQMAEPLALLLASGGDKRIWPDGVTGRNRYGTLTRPAEDEISFSSSTASNPSAFAFTAASNALAQLLGPAAASVTSEDWFGGIHSSLAEALDCSNASTILAASGTDAELLALGIVSALSPRPLTNVFVAPDETGNGIPQAAAGRHFADVTAQGVTVLAGGEIAGLPADRIEACAIAIRDERGRQRAPADIDADMIALVERELRKGRDVIVHVLDTSKTGLTGVTRPAAKHAMALAPGRVRVIIDSCQLRGPIGNVRDDLENGFIVLVTVSKFFASPPFAGALLLPADIAADLKECPFPSGLIDYTAAQDWCPSLREQLSFDFTSEMNIGLGLRWQAGLANLQAYTAVPSEISDAVKKQFVEAIRQRVRAERGFFLHEDDEGEHLDGRAIVGLTIDGPLPMAQTIQTRLRAAPGVVCHVGQPVRVADRAVLRVALSAPHVLAVSDRIGSGQSMEQAMTPLIVELETLFAKWERIHHALAS